MTYVLILLSVVGNAEPTCNSISESKSHMKRLKEALFRDYDSSARPVRLWSDQTKVAVEMIPLSLGFVRSRLLVAHILAYNYTRQQEIWKIKIAIQQLWTSIIWNLLEMKGCASPFRELITAACLNLHVSKNITLGIISDIVRLIELILEFQKRI
jgi:hypothetical protein